MTMDWSDEGSALKTRGKPPRAVARTLRISAVSVHGGTASSSLAEDRMEMRGLVERPLRAAMARAVALCRSGAAVEALGEVVTARRNTPFDGRDLASDEALALAETWEFQAAYDLSQDRLGEGLDNLAIAEQILGSRPEHDAHRRRVCAEIALRIPVSAPGLALMRADHLADARPFPEGSRKFRELLHVLLEANSDV